MSFSKIPSDSWYPEIKNGIFFYLHPSVHLILQNFPIHLYTDGYKKIMKFYLRKLKNTYFGFFIFISPPYENKMYIFF